MTADGLKGANFWLRDGSNSPRQVHVGLGTNHSRMPEALLFLQRLADRWATAQAAAVSECDRRNRQSAADWISIHCPCRRQLLSGDADRSAAGPGAKQY